MKIVNLQSLPTETWITPKGKFGSIDVPISEALGADAKSANLAQRHPFDVMMTTVPAGKAACPYHSHSAQFEYYQVLQGRGRVRSEAGYADIGVGDTFIFAPGEAHQILASETEAITFLVVADNPVGECCYYPDSQKWMVRHPARRLIRSEGLDYLDGEE